MLLAILAAAAVAAPSDTAAPAPAAPTTTVAPVDVKPKPKAENDPDKLVCVNEAVTGSHRPVQICRRQRDLDADRDAFKNNIQGGGRTKPSGGFSPG